MLNVQNFNELVIFNDLLIQFIHFRENIILIIILFHIKSISINRYTVEMFGPGCKDKFNNKILNFVTMFPYFFNTIIKKTM